MHALGFCGVFMQYMLNLITFRGTVKKSNANTKYDLNDVLFSGLPVACTLKVFNQPQV